MDHKQRHKISQRSRIRTVLVVLMLWIPLWAEAKLVLYSFEEMVQKSSSIIVGQVQSTSGGLIRKPRAKVIIIRLIKGAMPESPLLLYYGTPALTVFAREDLTKLNEGRQYIMFLTGQNKGYRLVGADAGAYEIDTKGQVSDAGKKVPIDTFVAKVLAVPPKEAETHK